jgi:hypothetical protein
MTSYTIIAYRPDHVDTCRGCVMGRTGSDHEISFYSELQQAAEKAADYDTRDEERDAAYAAWQVTLLVDGLDESEWWADRDWREEETDPFETFNALKNEALKTTAERKREEKRRQEQQEADARRRRAVAAAAAKEEAERLQLRELLEKYPEESR